MLQRLGAWLLLLCAGSAGAAQPWVEWQSFQNGFIDDGRVIDWTAGARTVSEGQSYALFFALVANDRAQFDKILDWTQTNLAAGDLSKHLPAWLWGSRSDGSRGVVDANSATDADLWVAYALLEASRLWGVSNYGRIGRSMLKRVREQSVVHVDGGPWLLLPGPRGFVLDNGGYRINPSYYVPAQLQRFALEDPQGPWAALLNDYVAMVQANAPLGRLPDWLAWQTDRWVIDPVNGGVGSYDAVRCYLWAAQAVGGEQSSVAQLRKLLLPFLQLYDVQQTLPERWTVGNSGVSGGAPVGFYAALLPLAALDRDAGRAPLLATHLRASARDGLYGRPADYYNQVLILFGKAYFDGRYRFDAKGRLVPAWH